MKTLIYKYTPSMRLVLILVLVFCSTLMLFSCNSKQEVAKPTMVTPAMVTPIAKDSVTHKYKSYPNRIISLTDSQLTVVNIGDTVRLNPLGNIYVIQKIASVQVEQTK